MLVFVHGFLGFGSPQGGAEYWYGENSVFVETAKDQFGLTAAHFIDTKYEFFSSSSNRYYQGSSYELPLSEGPYHIISHSMGCAFAEGLKSSLIDKGLSIGKTIHINAHQRATVPAFNGKVEDVVFYDISNDLVSGHHTYFLNRRFNSVKLKSRLAANERHKEPLRSDVMWSQLASFL